VAHELPSGAAPDDTGPGADELGGSVVGGVLGWIGLPFAVGTAGAAPGVVGAPALPDPPQALSADAASASTARTRRWCTGRAYPN
jgi:hypothetical protein